VTAKIVMDDGGGPIIGSITLPGAMVSTPVTLSNFDNTGVAGWDWTILDTPAPSVTLNPIPPPVFTSTTVITPDVKGHTVLVRLTTYTDAARTNIDDTDQQVIRVQFDPPFDWTIPAAGQSIENDILRGWASDVNRMLRELQAFIDAGGGGGGAGVPSEVDAAATVTLPEKFSHQFDNKIKVNGRLCVKGLLRGTARARTPILMDPVSVATPTAIPVGRDVSVPVVDTAVLLLPRKGTPGDEVIVYNDTDSAFVASILGDGPLINGLAFFNLTTAREAVKLRRQKGQQWNVVI
jgi:hypothetical protein